MPALLINVDVRQLEDFAAALKVASSGVGRVLDKAASDTANKGNRIARDNARRSSGTHGKWYPKRFSVDKLGEAIYVYGPKGRPQGEMSFEYGSRNQRPHLDVNRSADVIEHEFTQRVARDLGHHLDRTLG